MDKAIDIECAKLLGYTVYHYDKDYAKNCYFMLMDAEFDPVVTSSFRAGERKTEDEAWSDAPGFTYDERTTPILLAAIEKRNLRADYMEALEDILGINVYQDGPFEGLSIDVEWKLLTAEPEQHARAFVETIKRYE